MRQEISLSQLNLEIKNILKAHCQAEYMVVAEIAEIRETARGHCYLDLAEKEEGQILAKMRATIWAYQYRNISGWFESITGKSLSVGMKVLCKVNINFHEVYGISLNVLDIDPNFTLGERAANRNQIIEQLKKEGIYDMNRELEIPMICQKIALISSATAAGYGDFKRQLEQNEYGYRFNIDFYAASMQGDKAAESITDSLIKIFNSEIEYDLTIILRGGGAGLDLDCFDDVNLVTHLAQFPLPILTAIGHDRDETISDLVAHTSVKTPTAAAIFLVDKMLEYESLVERIFLRIKDKAAKELHIQKYELQKIYHSLQKTTQNRLVKERDKINQSVFYMKSNSKKLLSDALSHLNHSVFQVRTYKNKQIDRSKGQLELMEEKVKLMDPEKLLRQGYSISTVNGVPIHLLEKIVEGDKMKTQSYHHTIESEITDIKSKNNG
ncbi:MAG: exodeoxyribonuclease VII large subunit [Cyclobacteriaceae bacterium]|nr:exodeoxyribonuclease VII large subunit [Cyclobacteriaceae bacterium]MCH8515382.1 exodeoxyribonuclease VII large subunit [Cyclobacteriaceae bacterium]